MKKIVLLLGFLSFSMLGRTQAPGTIIDQFDYTGGPGDIYENIWPVTGSSIYQFYLCAINVPDSLIITLGNYSAGFYAGSWEHFGFRKYSFNGNYVNGPTSNMPAGVSGWMNCDPDGTIMVVVSIPPGICEMKWRIHGNLQNPTIYSLYLFEISREPAAQYILDTIYSYSCLGPSRKIEKLDYCTYRLHIYADSSIQTTVTIREPLCNQGGFFEFSGYPWFNEYNLSGGIYQRTISNSVCSEEFELNLIDSSACQIYAPNVFSPNDDGWNDVWFIGCDKDLNYDLSIYDRWGSLVHYGSYTTNQTGWDGTMNGEHAESAVYTYRAILHSKPDAIIMIGDITLLH